MLKVAWCILCLTIILFACDQSSTIDGNEPFLISGKRAIVFTTADSSKLRLTPTDTLTFQLYDQPVETEITVFIDPHTTFQTHIGIGGALTDASAEVFAKLSKQQQEELLKAYFNIEDGIGYTMARTNMNSCDFSSSSYTYVQDYDTLLISFNISTDKAFKIPFIKQAMKAADGDLLLFVSPWSPPAWMKNNNNMLQGGKLIPKFYQTWANYYVKFINSYEEEGIPIWGLTVQNEPMAKQIWESCIYTAQEERDFIKNYLGPTLHNANLQNKKLIAWDHNRDLLFHRASVLYNDEEASKYIWGIGVHWYEDWSGGSQMFENTQLVNQSWANKNILFTEGCNPSFNIERINDWELGERYGESMIHDFNTGMAGWTDWNILLDELGGPNHVGNFCFAPIHANTVTGELIYTNAYYYIGHFSKFIRPQAKRLQASASRSNLLTTAFQNQDGRIVVIVMNKSDKKINYRIWIENHSIPIQALPNSIASIIID